MSTNAKKGRNKGGNACEAEKQSAAPPTVQPRTAKTPADPALSAAASIRIDRSIPCRRKNPLDTRQTITLALPVCLPGPSTRVYGWPGGTRW